MASMNQYSDIVNANRVELNPPEADKYVGDYTDELPSPEAVENEINVDMLQ